MTDLSVGHVWLLLNKINNLPTQHPLPAARPARVSPRCRWQADLRPVAERHRRRWRPEQGAFVGALTYTMARWKGRKGRIERCGLFVDAFLVGCFCWMGRHRVACTPRSRLRSQLAHACVPLEWDTGDTPTACNNAVANAQPSTPAAASPPSAPMN